METWGAWGWTSVHNRVSGLKSCKPGGYGAEILLMHGGGAIKAEGARVGGWGGRALKLGLKFCKWEVSGLQFCEQE